MFTIVNDDRKRCLNFEHHSTGIIHDHSMHVESEIVNYSDNIFMAKATVAMIVNYHCKKLIVKALGSVFTIYFLNILRMRPISWFVCSW
jgi:hypothetical protein